VFHFSPPRCVTVPRVSCYNSAAALLALALSPSRVFNFFESLCESVTQSISSRVNGNKLRVSTHGTFDVTAFISASQLFPLISFSLSLSRSVPEKALHSGSLNLRGASRRRIAHSWAREFLRGRKQFREAGGNAGPMNVQRIENRRGIQLDRTDVTSKGRRSNVSI